VGFSNLTLTPERLENMRIEMRPKFERERTSLVVTRGSVKGRARAVHVARYAIDGLTGYLKWTPLCATRFEDLVYPLTGTLDDVSCLRCEPLLSIVDGIELDEGQFTVSESPIPLL
jgi:hypothetical protein